MSYLTMPNGHTSCQVSMIWLVHKLGQYRCFDTWVNLNSNLIQMNQAIITTTYEPKKIDMELRDEKAYGII